MGIGHRKKQQSFFNSSSKHKLCHGGTLRQARAGRGARPLSTKEPLHLVFKVNRAELKFGLRSGPCQKIVFQIIQKYSTQFFVKIDQISIQNDHCHLLVRATRRSHFHHFSRVTAGQIAQRFEKQGLLRSKAKTTLIKTSRKSSVTGTPRTQIHKGTGLWKHRPFSRVVRGWRAYKIAKDYIRLNEFEATGQLPYRKERLRGLSSIEWELFG